MNEGSPANPSLNGAQILAKLLALGALGAAFTDSAFAITGSSDATKIARFEVDGLTTATTRVYTLPDASIVVAGSASALTSGRVPFATTGGLLTDSAALTWSGTSFATTATGAVSFSTAGGYTSTVATGTAPFTATSTTACPNLNASLLLGSTWAAPGTIGSGTPAAGAFTTLTASGATTLTSTTDATAIGVGAVILSGGASIAKTLWVGTGVTVSGSGTTPGYTAVNTNAAAGSSWAFRVTSAGNLQICQPSQNNWLTIAHASGAITSLGAVTISDATASTTTGTGALILSAGGLGVVGRINAGGIIQSNSNIRTFGGSLIADYGSGGSVGGAASTIESNANIVLWSSNYYYNGANDVRARAGGASRLRMDITTSGTAGEIVLQCAATGAADSTISYANVATFSTAGTALAGTLSVTGAVTLSSTLQLGNAAVAATPTPTHTITVKDSTGTTYRVPCVV